MSIINIMSWNTLAWYLNQIPISLARLKVTIGPLTGTPSHPMQLKLTFEQINICESQETLAREWEIRQGKDDLCYLLAIPFGESVESLEFDLMERVDYWRWVFKDTSLLSVFLSTSCLRWGKKITSCFCKEVHYKLTRLVHHGVNLLKPSAKAVCFYKARCYRDGKSHLYN